jgi:uncharacterized membrane protein YsdA (DUF1294 family)/cold shock CspA family protein
MQAGLHGSGQLPDYHLPAMRFTGTLRTWHDERGFGFIEAAPGSQPLFVHIKDFPEGSGRPSVGQVLSFEVERRADGRKKACKVQYPARARPVARPRADEPAPWTWPRALAIPAFCALYALAAWRWGFSPVVLIAYVALSLVALLAYALDKSAAVSGRRRTPEQTLHLVGLAGGWPGALLAQQLLRHKTRTRSFIAEFWLTVVVNVAAFVLWHSGALPLPRPPGVA